ncbi:putative cytochrome P450 [Cutaneotrichosporon oleaginosum]|uniref:Putative cytochrome P450 n=2 Tax=Cutaneotrichosporon oleaginosum TaxID=879819 RepID=A0A0J1BBD6_9TREE|nr:putative cytochrome P450 [Cutaneotrichosporon oleaginosum]KLT45304.1 putative cytochrome P450 [Cutaneotrichosporon oleaginosum]
MVFRDHFGAWRNFPGPRPTHWFWGNIHEVMQTSPQQCHQRWLDKYGRVVRVHDVGGRAKLVCSDPVATQYLLLHPDAFIKPAGPNRILTDALDKGLVTVEGRAHRRQRRVLNPAFGWVQIQGLAPMIMDKVGEMRDKFARLIEEEMAGTGRVGRRMDVLHYMSETALDIIGEAGFGYDFNAIGDANSPLRNAYTSAVQHAFEFDATVMLTVMDARFGAIPTSRVRNMHAARSAAQVIGREIVAEKKKQVINYNKGLDKESLGKDVLSLMIRANMDPALRPDQRLTDDEVVAQIATVLFAGHETTSTALMWCLYHLSLHQDMQQRLRDELLEVPDERPDFDTLMNLPYLDKVVHESLRLESPVPNISRVATQDGVVPLSAPVTGRDGRPIEAIRVRKGEVIEVPLTYMNTLAEVWGPDAREFNPDRRDTGVPTQQLPGVWGGIMSFIGGPRNCIGHRLTILEMKAVLFALLRSFVFEQLPDPPKIKRTYMVIQRAVVVGEEEYGPQMPLLVRPYVET